MCIRDSSIGWSGVLLNGWVGTALVDLESFLMMGRSIGWSGVILNDWAQHWLTGGHSWWLGPALIDLGSFLMIGPGTDWPGVILKSHDSSATPADVNNIVICLPRMPMCDLFGNCGKRLRGCDPCLVETWWASAVSSVAWLVQLPCTCACLFSAQMPRCVGSARLVVCLNASPNVYARSQGMEGQSINLGGKGLPPF